MICSWTGDRIIQISREIDRHSFRFQREVLENAGSAKAGFTVGDYEIGKFFACVEFDGQPG
jgi:hypothetical protein